MLPLVTFIAVSSVGWFAPVPLYPDPRASICASNAAPVGSTLLLRDSKTHREATCRVVGKIATPRGQLVSVSEAVRSALGFKGVTTLSIYREVAAIRPCAEPPPASMCNAPPAACLLTGFLVICLPKT